MYEQSVLHEVVADHLHALSNPDTFSFSRLGLIQPRAAPANVAAFVRRELGLADDEDINCQHAPTSHPSESVYCTIDDVILFQEDADADVHVGQLRANLSVGNEPLAIVAVWPMVSGPVDGAATWRFSDNLKLIHGESIVDVVCWTRHNDAVAKHVAPSAVLLIT